MSRRGCWAADLRSTGNSPTAARPADYDEWEQRGAAGWRWETVLPFFKKVERDIDFDGPLHGAEGRIPVRRVFPDNWSDYAKAVAEAFKQAGYRYVPTRTASSRTATIRSPCRTCMTDGYRRRSAISAPRSGSATT